MLIVIPTIPFIKWTIPAKGIYDVDGRNIRRRVMPGIWYNIHRCKCKSEAKRITLQLNAL